MLHISLHKKSQHEIITVKAGLFSPGGSHARIVSCGETRVGARMQQTQTSVAMGINLKNGPTVSPGLIIDKEDFDIVQRQSANAVQASGELLG